MRTKIDLDLCRRAKWWDEARFGMFIHWGLYAIPAFDEWAMSTSLIKLDDYEALAKKFEALKYEPRKWAELAASAGMKYMVLTTKHHDGFCLFNSKYTDYNAVNSAAKRDLVAEYVAACREYGLKVGFYYSVTDWHHPNFPPIGDKFSELFALDSDRRKTDPDKYVEYMRGQLTELLTNYGQIDILWIDGGWLFYPEDVIAEKRKLIPGWNESEYIRKPLLDMIRKLQPDMLVNDRLESKDEDFTTPEQSIPSEPLKDAQGRELFWESCCTMSGNHWGYDKYEKVMRTEGELLGILSSAAAAGGNLLLNIGPCADGSVPPLVERTLRKLGKWLKKYGESIYCTQSAPLSHHRNGVMSRRGSKIYMHILDWPQDGRIELPSFNGIVKSVKILKGASLKADGNYVILPSKPVSKLDTVLEIEYAEVPTLRLPEAKPANDKPEYEVVCGKPIKVTGDINEADWCGAHKVHISQDTNLDMPKEEFYQFAKYGHCSCVFRAMHSGGLLYMAVEVESPSRIPRRPEFANGLFRAPGDEARILLAANTALDRITYNPESFEISVDAAGSAWMPGEDANPGMIFRHAAKHTEKGFNVVVAIPLSIMLKDKSNQSSALKPGDVFKCNINIVQTAPLPKWKMPTGEVAEKHMDSMFQPRFPPAHKVFWKGSSSFEQPFFNVKVWALCKLLK